jgi:hypothetical protein
MQRDWNIIVLSDLGILCCGLKTVDLPDKR